MKKTKFMTRLGAVVFALAILVAMAVPAMADTVNVYSGTNNAIATGVAGTTSIPITKTIVVFNTDNQEVRLPDISYTYTVQGHNVSDSTTVSDGTNTEHVKSGVNGGITGCTITFNPATKVAAKTTGTEVEVSGNLTVDLSKFTRAGVYRYKITEDATPTSVRNQGLEPRVSSGTGDMYDPTRYVDVYINNPDATHTGFWMSGAVIFKTQLNSSSGQGVGNDIITTTTEKTTGWQPKVEPGASQTDFDYTDDVTVDRYFTYNVDVTKEITGNLADKSHQFPFDVTVTGSTLLNHHPITFDVDNKGVASTGTIIADTPFTDNTAKLADGEHYKLIGLPRGSQITVKEYNDTRDQYKLTTTLTGTTSTSTNTATVMASDLTKLHPFGETNVLINSGNADKSVTTANTVIKFTNDISDISPTGLAFRIAPYVLMLTAAVSMILLFAKRRREITDMI